MKKLTLTALSAAAIVCATIPPAQADLNNELGGFYVNTMDTFPLLQGDATDAQLSERLDTVFTEALKRMSSQPGGAS